MAVEGLVNCYGVLRLGEPYSTANLERWPMAQKLRLVLQICDNVRLPCDHRLLSLVDYLSKPRNALVHPKAQKHQLGDPGIIETSDPWLAEVNRSVQSLKEFSQLFGTLSADTLVAAESFGETW